MKKTYTFDVTQEDIDKGVKGDMCKCPIARAAKRTLRHRKRKITIDGKYLNLVRNLGKRPWWGDTLEKEYALPEVAITFIVNYDHDRPVQPFSFEMEI